MKATYQFRDVQAVIQGIDGIKVSAVTLYRYAKNGLLVPSVSCGKGSGLCCLWSFEDIVLLRIYLWITRKCGFEMKSIREYLSEIRRMMKYGFHVDSNTIGNAHVVKRHVPVRMTVDVGYFIDTTKEWLEHNTPGGG